MNLHYHHHHYHYHHYHLHLGPVVEPAQAVAAAVDEHLGQVVELGDELLDVAGVALTVGPGAPHAAEQAVGMIELPALEREEEGGEGLEPGDDNDDQNGQDDVLDVPDQPVEGEGGGAVVRAVVEGRDLIVLPGAISEIYDTSYLKLRSLLPPSRIGTCVL